MQQNNLPGPQRPTLPYFEAPKAPKAPKSPRAGEYSYIRGENERS